jgi:hypothetical protein
LTINKDDTNIVAVTLNPDSGHHFNLSVAPDAAHNSGLISASPELDLSIGLFFAPIAADFLDVPDYALDETFHVLLSGQDPAQILPLPENVATLWPGGIQVAAGSLVLSSTSALPGSTVTVPQGQCLTSTQTPEVGSHPVLGYFQVVACP